MTAVVVACLGSRFRGDDAAGPLVGDRLRAGGVEVRECGDDPTRLLDEWVHLDRLVIVDAVRSGAEPGTVHRVDASTGALPHGLAPASSHLVGVAEALALARALDRLPAEVVVYGIEGVRFETGSPVSPVVAAAVDRVAAAVLEELG